jgi:peptidoglycan-associated lipoprotein
MRSPQALIGTVGTIATLALVAACSKKAPETGPAPLSADSIARLRASDSVAKAMAAANAAQATKDSIAKANSDAALAAAAAAAAKKAALKQDMTSQIYFDFDKSTLTDSAKAKLDRKIAILNANPGVGVQIEGHTDERGSSEYNLALGQQRAASVKRYLTQHGIADARITIISYGEEKPAAQGHDETAYSVNRRAEFVITVGEVATAP